MGRWCTILGVLVSIGTAYLVMQFNSIMDYVQALFSFFIAPLFGTVLLGMLWKRATPAGGFWGLLAGTASSIGMWAWVKLNPAALPSSPSRRNAKDMAENMYRALWCWIICVVVTVVVSLVTKPKAREQNSTGLVYGCTELPSEGPSAALPAADLLGGRGGCGVRGPEHYLLVGEYDITNRVRFRSGSSSASCCRSTASSSWAPALTTGATRGNIVLGRTPRRNLVGRAVIGSGLHLQLCLLAHPGKKIEFMANGMTFGVIVGNRGFFPDHLAQSGREEMIAALEKAGYGVVCLTPEETKHGAVETRAEAQPCADLFRASRDKIDGIIVTLPNFGDERAIADALRLADLRRARADPGHARHRRPHDHRGPPRQLLRQDVRLQ